MSRSNRFRHIDGALAAFQSELTAIFAGELPGLRGIELEGAHALIQRCFAIAAAVADHTTALASFLDVTELSA